MIKGNENSNTIPNSVKPIPEIIENKKAYSLLISNRAISFRKQLADHLNLVFIPGATFKTWKSRFLYPQENIPAPNVEQYTAAMSDALIFQLQKQVDYLIDQKKDIDQLIKDSKKIINKYKNEQKGS